MDVLILAGGRGSRLGDLGRERPKALVEIGGTPIIGHVIRHCLVLDPRRVVVAGGYRFDELRRFVDGLGNPVLSAVDTGIDTDTGGRVARSLAGIRGDRFLLCWCDGLTDLDLDALVTFHDASGAAATVAAVNPPERFGRVIFDGDLVTAFAEKQPDPDTWISAGFFVVERGAIDADAGDDCSWERDVLPGLAAHGRLAGYRHRGFWQCMDTPSEQRLLDDLARRGDPPWRPGAARDGGR